MKAIAPTVYFCTLTLLAVGAPALAAGPVDGEVGAIWWSSELETESTAMSGTGDSDTPGIRAELWLFQRYGVRASQYSAESDGLGSGDADCTTVDLMWRAFSPSENNFLAVGLGWQQNGLGAAGVNGDTSGPRLALEGRLSFLGKAFAYGQGAYAPNLDDTEITGIADGQLESLDGYEYELGVGWNVAPFVSLTAGYRASSIDFTQSMLVPTSPATTSTDNRGPIVGLGDGGGSTSGGGIGMSVAAAPGSTETTGFFIGAGFRF